jgi:hypothetical protein
LTRIYWAANSILKKDFKEDKIECIIYWARWYMPVIPTLMRQRITSLRAAWVTHHPVSKEEWLCTMDLLVIVCIVYWMCTT